MANVAQRANQWITGRDTGISSKVIWSVMQMVTPGDTGVDAREDPGAPLQPG